MSDKNTIELIKLPGAHKYLPGAPYVIGDKYLLLEEIQTEGYNRYIKVKRLRDYYIEVLNSENFK